MTIISQTALFSIVERVSPQGVWELMCARVCARESRRVRSEGCEGVRREVIEEVKRRRDSVQRSARVILTGTRHFLSAAERINNLNCEAEGRLEISTGCSQHSQCDWTCGVFYTQKQTQRSASYSLFKKKKQMFVSSDCRCSS